jgi:hypothetical protein
VLHIASHAAPAAGRWLGARCRRARARHTSDVTGSANVTAWIETGKRSSRRAVARDAMHPFVSGGQWPCTTDGEVCATVRAARRMPAKRPNRRVPGSAFLTRRFLERPAGMLFNIAGPTGTLVHQSHRGTVRRLMASVGRAVSEYTYLADACCLKRHRCSCRSAKRMSKRGLPKNAKCPCRDSTAWCKGRAWLIAAERRSHQRRYLVANRRADRSARHRVCSLFPAGRLSVAAIVRHALAIIPTTTTAYGPSRGEPQPLSSPSHFRRALLSAPRRILWMYRGLPRTRPVAMAPDRRRSHKTDGVGCMDGCARATGAEAWRAS